MATYTTNYNLKKPAATDNISIDDLNGNFDKLDSANGYYSATFYANSWDTSQGYCRQTVSVSGVTSGFECDGFYTEANTDWNINTALQEGLQTMFADGKFNTSFGDGTLYWAYAGITKPSIDMPIYFKRKVDK